MRVSTMRRAGWKNILVKMCSCKNIFVCGRFEIEWNSAPNSFSSLSTWAKFNMPVNWWLIKMDTFNGVEYQSENHTTIWDICYWLVTNPTAHAWIRKLLNLWLNSSLFSLTNLCRCCCSYTVGTNVKRTHFSRPHSLLKQTKL